MVDGISRIKVAQNVSGSQVSAQNSSAQSGDEPLVPFLNVKKAASLIEPECSGIEIRNGGKTHHFGKLSSKYDQDPKYSYTVDDGKSKQGLIMDRSGVPKLAWDMNEHQSIDPFQHKNTDEGRQLFADIEVGNAKIEKDTLITPRAGSRTGTVQPNVVTQTGCQ